MNALIANAQGRELLDAEKHQLQQILRSLGWNAQKTRSQVKGAVQSEPRTLSFPVEFQNSVSDRRRALETLGDMDIPGIRAGLAKMTGYVPTNLPQSIEAFADAKSSSTQAAILARLYTSTERNDQTQRLQFWARGLTGLEVMQANVQFMEQHPVEGRGVLFHEYGHVWTSKILALEEGRSETYLEAFAELFRSAAALHENAPWAQACGCRGTDVLYGTEVPNLVIPHWQNLHIPHNIYQAGRFAVSNRLIEHLGGLGERELHGIAKACDVGKLPCERTRFEDVLRDIEREAGKKGFADAVLQDPSLRIGGMTPGTVALGFRTADKNGYRIECFEILSTGAQWGTSKQTYPPNWDTVNVNSDTFHFEGVKSRIVPFEIHFHHPVHDLHLRMNVTSGVISITPETILDVALQGNTGWPGGNTTISFSIAGQPHKPITTMIEITEGQRLDFQRRKGVQFPR